MEPPGGFLVRPPANLPMATSVEAAEEGPAKGFNKVSLLSGGHDRKLKFQFWSMFCRFPAKLGPKTASNWSGSKTGAELT